MKRVIPALIILVLLGLLAGWWFSPTEALKRRTKTLLRVLTLESGSGVAGRQMGTYSLNALLASEVRLESQALAQANGSFSREEMESAFSWLCNQAKQTSFRLERIQQITVGKQEARVEATIFGMVELPNYRPADGNHEVIFDWIQTNDGWRLSAASWGPAD